jgi:hypothetical protein
MLPFMKKTWLRIIRSLTILATATTLAVAQQAATTDVNSVLVQARGEIRSFEKAGGKKSDPNHPVEKWVQALWKLHEDSPGTPGAAKAAIEAVHLLIHADRFQDAYERADSIPPDDPAWEGVPEILVEGAALQHDSTYFFRKLPAVLSRTTSPSIRAAVQWGLGRVWLSEKQEEKAKAAFEAAVEFAPDSAAGRQAERQLYELLHLGPGQPAPLFSATALDGSRTSLADHRGKPVVLVFWSST